MIALDPKQTFDVTLDIEAALPLEERRKFVFRFLTARKAAELARLSAEADTAPVEKASALLEEGLALALVGGGDKPLGELLTIDELWELSLKLATGSRLQEMDRKKSVLQSVSAALAQATTSAAAAPAASV